MLELSLHILDIVENSTRAEAKKVFITLIENTGRDTISVEIRDDGAGMTEEMLKKVTDPFFTTKTVRKIGLGIPMFAQAVESVHGKLTIESKAGEGTRVAAEFKLHHIDRQPLGDIGSTMVTLIAGNTDVEFIYRHKRDDREYLFDTREVKKVIAKVPINHPDILNFIRKHIHEGLLEIETEA
ncbi:MAG TPA: ATP-binding protein [Nitrospirota bacterium]|nr:ATP-binding protein [Nitrospirota bacterium]